MASPSGSPKTNGPTKLTVVTPSRRAYSAEPPSRKSSARSVHTPLENTTSRDLLSSVHRSASARRTNAPTPHARAAARALDLRRTAIFTPGKNRRRSVREQRETPRDVLRALSHALAPQSEPIVSSSPKTDRRRSVAATILEEEDEEDDLIDAPPRLSLALDDDEEGELQPPRLSDVADYTVQSIEMPRRAISENPRLSRSSFGSVRMSDFRGPILDGTEIGVDSGFFPRAGLDDTTVEGAENDVSYEHIDEERRAALALNRESFGLDMADHNESTFVMDLEQPLDDGEPLPALEEQEPTAREEEETALLGGDLGDQGESLVLDQDKTGEVDVDSGSEVTETAPIDGSKRGKKRKRAKVSAYGIEYPSLPPAIIKRLAQTFAQTGGLSKSKITPDALHALSQASDWFFEQVGDSLQAYAKHAGRKTIDESDVLTLLRRQRQIGPASTAFSLAQKYLPRELLQNIRMSVPVPAPKRRKKANAEADADGDEDG